MLFLGIETSCDETGVALVENDATHSHLLAHALHSQIAMHNAYGGVVPELASRDHIRRVLPLLEEVLQAAGRRKEAIDAVAYTAGPGLAGALLVGAAIASALAYALGKPVAPIHHLEGHLLSPLLADPAPEFPFLALLVSGGHTQLMAVQGVGQYRLLGETLDDAAGEAFDKSAKLLGLPYPGGPHLSRLAAFGNADNFSLPRPLLHSKDLDFSFSGLKTAVLTHVKQLNASNVCEQAKADLAAAVQLAIVEVLVAKCVRALKQTAFKRLVVAGGVGANTLLRERLGEALQALGVRSYFPPLSLCTDNGAMIAFAAAMRERYGCLGLRSAIDGGFSVKPRWPLTDLDASTTRITDNG